jgi:cold shock CspA family protein
VKHWYDDEGWGVADAPEAPGGIFIHFSFINAEGYRSLRDGEEVELDLEGPLPHEQDGCRWYVGRVRRLS